MNKEQQSNNIHRDYSTISPSAKSLLLMKGYTNIPFAKRAAELISYPYNYSPYFNKKDFTFWARVAHFENRYWSIDQLLNEIPAKNILELSSGFSFRGLNAVKENNVHYIDTDLSEIISIKKQIIHQLQDENFVAKGKLETLPLNALDENQFQETVNHFSKEKIIIVNEGLLMYLSNDEKEKLCGNIRKVLQRHGGYWITADIYVKKEFENNFLKIDDKLSAFFKQHNIEENKFDSFQSAEIFFKQQGFTIDKEATPDYSKLNSVNYMLQSATQQQLFQLKDKGKIHATWRLKLSAH